MILIVLSSGLLSVLGLLVTRKFIDFEKLRASHDVGGYLLAVVGALYAVLLGLIVVDAMQQYQHAREITERETNTLADIYILAKSLSEPRRSQLQQMCRDYDEQVIKTEFAQMRSGSFCSLARTKAVNLMTSLMDYEPQTEREKAVYPQLVAESSQFWKDRQARVSIAGKGVPPFEWAVLVTGAFITVFFTFFFAVENLPLQVLMTAMVAILISLNLSLLLLYAYPFSGALSVQPKPFESISDIFTSG